MGTIYHHAIVVVGWESDGLDEAHQKAREIFEWVSPLSETKVNGYRSFFIPPDGSKEGWAESNMGDERREIFRQFVRELYRRGKCVEAVEVGFGELRPSVRDLLHGLDS